VGHGIKNILTQQFAELDDLLGVAGWAEPTAPAGEGEQELMTAVRAAHPGEAVGEVTAFEIVVYHLGDDRAEEAVVLGKTCVIGMDELVEVTMEQIPQRGVLRSAGVIGLGGMEERFRVSHAGQVKHGLCQSKRICWKHPLARSYKAK